MIELMRAQCPLDAAPALGLRSPAHKTRQVVQPAARSVSAQDGAVQEVARLKVPAWSKAVEIRGYAGAGSSTRGSGWAPSRPTASWECRAAQSHQARPEEAQGPS
jgi:hypothetical protein